ncbi:MAG: peptide ABC transporter substrate-binding protein [Steroidobacter sp.]
MKGIRESDWKRLRELKPVALDRFCSRVLSDVEKASSASAATSHQRYLTIYELIQDRDKELGQIFDGLSRSNAVGKLVLMYRAALVTEDELTSFSEEIRSVIAGSQDI